MTANSGAAAAEAEKQRIKREKLEAWKRKKAEEAAASAGSAATTPKPASPAPEPAPAVASQTPPVSGLPAKPLAAINAGLPAKPISISTSKAALKPASPNLPANPADATAAAAAAAAAISSRLSSLGGNAPARSNALPASLPAKPAFSLGTGALRPSGLKNSLTMGGEDDEGKKKIGMIKFEGEVDMSLGDGAGDGDDDEEDLEGGAVYKAKGDEGRAARMAALVQEQEDTTMENGDEEVKDEQSKQKMDVDGAEEEEEEEEEEDELDAFMKGVNDQVKNVDKADRAKGKRVVDVSEHTEPLDDAEEEEQNEEDAVGVSAQDILALAAKKVKKGRELTAPDHSKINYLPFRKAFYSAPPEVAELTQEQVDLLRLEMDDIKIRGADPPKPATKWSYFGIDVIKGLEYVAPTSIQAQAIPAIMSGRDIIGVAKTGSGKTMAFILPMFRHIKDQPPLRALEGPVAMIMTPTRELATQIYKECKPFLKALGLRASCAYGGMPLKDNIADMKRGSEVIVCTPGRMIELLTTNSGRLINLQRVTYLVLDEADRMFDMGFEPQSCELTTLRDAAKQVMKIIGQIRPDRQTVLFSATFPRQMEALARKVLRRPLEITVGGRSVVADTITQIVEVRPEESKFNRMLELLGKLFNDEADARALIFVERQESADKLFVELKNKNYTCMPLHGGREQIDRDQTIVDFKNGSCPIVIATSVAARGLDVKQLKLVIQYDVPNHMEDYVHRAGRTGRAGNMGTCVTFITPEQDRYAVDILKALQASNAPVPPEVETMAKGTVSLTLCSFDFEADLACGSAAFADKVKAGKAQASGSGFGGKGLEKLDHERDAASRAERAAYGETPGEKKEGAAEEPDEGDKTAQNVADLEVEIMRGPAPDLAKGKKVPTSASAGDKAAAEEAAKKAEADALAAGYASPFLPSLEPNRDRSLTSLFSGDRKSSGAAGAASVLAKFNAMLKAKKSATHQEPDHSTESARRRDPDATDYHVCLFAVFSGKYESTLTLLGTQAIVWINDYPQKARWKVTNKDTMVHLVESTGASITNKGIFYEPGKEPGPNDLPKLHLLIESNEEFRVCLLTPFPSVPGGHSADPRSIVAQVKHAIAEIKQALIEGATMALEAEQRQPGGIGGGASAGRYSVI
ncbi:SPOSA6832_01837 [Sporobolomyces salmonicolor]|uniref:RNA helicase n=1 Tax=Sporidiobolus salmonicolor TaxID=5005 RepID=A0A0D6EJV2_SPOSA|nr:SPOSA6832_01837 [Sporobolomyces salmonicolor]